MGLINEGEEFVSLTDILGAEDALGELIPYVKEHKALEDKATAYVCRNFACQMPTTDSQELERLLAN